MESWVGILGTLVGVILGGGITLFVTRTQLKHQEKMERDKRQLQKLEEAHEVLSRIKQHYRVAHGNILVKVLASLESQDKREPGEPIPFDHLKMIVGFYAVSLKNEVEELIQFCVEEYGPLTAEAVGYDRLSKDQRKDLAQRLSEAYQRIEVKVEKLQSNLVELSRHYH